MKKAIAFVVALSAAATSFGQHEIGAKAGYNYLFTNHDGSELEVETNGGGYHVGGYYSYTPEDNIFIGGELLISNRRWNEITSSSTSSLVEVTEEEHTYYSNHYLEIPLSVKYGLNMRKGRYGDSKYLLFYAGPSAHLLLSTSGSSQKTYRIDAQAQTTVTQQDEVYETASLKEYFSPFQMGLNAGVSYRFGFGLTVDARYQFMLSSTNKDVSESLGTITQDEKGLIKQSMFMFSIGYSFVRD